MPKYLIQFESGKNNIAGVSLHIMKASKIVKAYSAEEAAEKARINDDGITAYSLRHFGYEPDYQMITNIIELK